MKSALQNPLLARTGPQNYQDGGTDTASKFFEMNLQQVASVNTNINRFMAAFIDHVSRASNAIAVAIASDRVVCVCGFAGAEGSRLHHSGENDAGELVRFRVRGERDEE